jgi:glycosyltransferase involved in cell wall biosynthesis
MPLVSVVIPTFNRARFIKAALDSALNQNTDNYDIWVIDDGSEDNTREIVQSTISRETRIPVNYLYSPNRGVSAARNLGIERSDGEWIAFLDSDDQWTPVKLERQIQYIRSHPKILLVHTGEKWIRNGIGVNPPSAYMKYGGEVFDRCLPVCMIGPSTSMVSRRLLDDIGGFDEDFPVCEDYDLWLRITSRHPVGFIDEELTIKYGGHEDQLSKSVVAMDYWRIRAMVNAAQNPGLTQAQRLSVINELYRKGRILLNGYIKHGRKDSFSEVLAMIHKVDGGAFQFPEDEIKFM